MPNWASLRETNGEGTLTGLLNNPAAKQIVSNYDFAAHTGSWGDRLTVVEVRVRVKKEVRDNDSPDFVEVTLTVNDVTTTGSACEEPVVPPGPTPTPTTDPTPSPTPTPNGDLDSNDDERNPDTGSEGALVNAGGPALWWSLLGALMLGVGMVFVRRSRTKGEHRA